jgi:predicted DNA-binding protein (UPF0251 family)
VIKRLTIAEVAERFGISRQGAEKLIKKYSIKVERTAVIKARTISMSDYKWLAKMREWASK